MLIAELSPLNLKLPMRRLVIS